MALCLERWARRVRPGEGLRGGALGLAPAPGSGPASAQPPELCCLFRA